MRDFEDRTYQNVKVDNDDFYSVGLTHDLEHYIMSNYGRHLVHVFNCTNLKILNGTRAFAISNGLTCLPDSGG